MKKKLVMVMISTMLVASLMACGSKKNESGKANTKLSSLLIIQIPRMLRRPRKRTVLRHNQGLSRDKGIGL